MTRQQVLPDSRVAGSDAQPSRLLSIEEACARATSLTKPITRTESVPLAAGVGRVLAEPLEARVAIPPFTQSAMDGYALAGGDGLAAGTELAVTERLPAGRRGRALREGAAARIFTGALLPDGADAVAMQEHVARAGDKIVLARAVRAGDNVRPRGEDIDPPERLLDRGERLDARHIGLIAGQGYGHVTAVARPRIAVVSTGSELRQPGQPLDAATIYDSNRAMLLALISAGGLDVRDGGWIADDADAIAARLRELAGECDLVVTSGGASVGGEDHAAAAVERAGGHAETLAMAVKPGKFTVVGRIAACAYLGLPGNPVASLVSWLLLGQAMVCALTGAPQRRPAGYPLSSLSRFQHRTGRTEFVPARLIEQGYGRIGIEILGRGGSARLRPLALADGLAEIAAERADIEPGDQMLFHPFRTII
ncbi:molybdopterin molybdenumtransferase MoeA [Bosea caraganae]|uniref:Molybdopterin molybdenumtransferase n=1 Tax=Bosea caraganae TaxID=2763117 RepID=A0A370KZV9_9HYPH|nr:molybdopterin molybdotransferase MoeA [Bosea caraganae]RDJ20386.1 molybdopterin molybdenumtransferase MoeA [Bosea caraganae]RDJ26533.1 molybdopterin molybdenumtransferase MoeA [Bosea caraganae]